MDFRSAADALIGSLVMKTQTIVVLAVMPCLLIGCDDPNPWKSQPPQKVPVNAQTTDEQDAGDSTGHNLLVANGAYPSASNLLVEVLKPSADQNDFIQVLTAKLAKSLVPTRQIASELAERAVFKQTGLDARDHLPVVGLFRVGRDIPDFAKAEDLVWEVHLTRGRIGVANVIWVSTTTKVAKTLFP
jgi:hypothetical protein